MSRPSFINVSYVLLLICTTCTDCMSLLDGSWELSLASRSSITSSGYA